MRWKVVCGRSGEAHHSPHHRRGAGGQPRVGKPRIAGCRWVDQSSGACSEAGQGAAAKGHSGHGQLPGRALIAYTYACRTLREHHVASMARPNASLDLKRLPAAHGGGVTKGQRSFAPFLEPRGA